MLICSFEISLLRLAYILNISMISQKWYSSTITPKYLVLWKDLNLTPEIAGTETLAAYVAICWELQNQTLYSCNHWNWSLSTGMFKIYSHNTKKLQSILLRKCLKLITPPVNLVLVGLRTHLFEIVSR